MQKTLNNEREGGNGHIKSLTLRILEFVAALHTADRRFENRSAGVAEGLSRLKPRLFTDNARTTNLFHLIAAVRNNPVAIE